MVDRGLGRQCPQVSGWGAVRKGQTFVWVLGRTRNPGSRQHVPQEEPAAAGGGGGGFELEGRGRWGGVRPRARKPQVGP